MQQNIFPPAAAPFPSFWGVSSLGAPEKKLYWNQNKKLKIAIKALIQNMPYFENMKYLTQKPVTIALSEVPWGASPCHSVNHPRGCDRVQEGGLFWTLKKGEEL